MSANQDHSQCTSRTNGEITSRDRKQERHFSCGLEYWLTYSRIAKVRSNVPQSAAWKKSSSVPPGVYSCGMKEEKGKKDEK